MYIQKLEIENIKGISKLEIDFSDFQKPGWHVLIGDNGSGKTTILRALGLAMLGGYEASKIRALAEMHPSRWIKRGAEFGIVTFWKFDSKEAPIIRFPLRYDSQGGMVSTSIPMADGTYYKEWVKSWFIAGYGPFRRFSQTQDSVFSTGKRQFFATLFSENEGIGETQRWLQDLELDSKSEPKNGEILKALIAFINHSELLPKGTILTNEINSKGIRLRDKAGQTFLFQEASDGIRSVLSMALDMVRSLFSVEGAFEQVEEMLRSGIIDYPGVILIDEVDAHLHPTWQIRIGNWFRKHFPKVQFIVTTHSPLICRGSEDSLIYRLVPEGSSEKSGPVSEVYHNRLVYGDILDAYGTQTFGENITNSAAAKEYRKRITILNKKSITGTITEKESEELQNLKQFIQA